MAANGDSGLGTSTAHPNSPYFPYPFSLSPLPADLRKGLVAPGVFGLLSVLSTTALLTFIGYRFIVWRKHYRTYIGYNQYVVLIINLLIADLQQGMSFLISFHWIKNDAILAPSRACFAQGWLLNIGDISSGLFVFFIAFHTFYCAVKGRRLGFNMFAILVIMTWLLSLVLTALGPILYREKYFVRAGAWCWASSNYEQERLALHYIWVFMIQFGTVIIYMAVLLHLKKTMSIILPTATQTATYAKIDRAAKLMVLYPVVYIVLTLPLSAGRMWSMAHNGANLPNTYQCVAGALISATGLVDALLYTLTRKQLISGSSPEDARPSSSSATHKDSHGWFKRSAVLSSASNTQHSISAPRTPSFVPAMDMGITQTRTVTVVGRRASAKSPAAEHFELPAVRNARDGLKHNRSTRREHSPTGSLEPIIQDYQPRGYGYGYGPGGNGYGLGVAQGFDPSSKGSRALVSVQPVEKEGFVESEGEGECDVERESDLESVGSAEKEGGGVRNLMFRR